MTKPIPRFSREHQVKSRDDAASPANDHTPVTGHYDYHDDDAPWNKLDQITQDIADLNSLIVRVGDLAENLMDAEDVPYTQQCRNAYATVVRLANRQSEHIEAQCDDLRRQLVREGRPKAVA